MKTIIAINGQALVGNIGGYLGLFLGYSILQLPNTIEVFAKKILKWYKTTKSRGNTFRRVIFRINVKEVSATIWNDTEKKTLSSTTIEDKLEARLLMIEDKLENVAELVLKINDSINVTKI